MLLLLLGFLSSVFKGSVDFKGARINHRNKSNTAASKRAGRIVKQKQ